MTFPRVLVCAVPIGLSGAGMRGPRLRGVAAMTEPGTYRVLRVLEAAQVIAQPPSWSLTTPGAGMGGFRVALLGGGLTAPVPGVSANPHLRCAHSRLGWGVIPDSPPFGGLSIFQLPEPQNHRLG
jgi:hypothetical protein